jgi:putative ABC transport system substrate-binding protein
LGLLLSETRDGQESRLTALRSGLRDLGYVEGKNIRLEVRSAGGDYAKLPKLAEELANL